MTVVDTHVHIWELESERYPFHPLGALRPTFAWTVEQQLAAMSAGGIDKGVIVQTSWYGYDNAYGTAAVAAHPDRFAYLGMVDPASPSVEADMDAMAAAGVTGLRLPARMRPDIEWYGTPCADRVWKKAGELGWKMGLFIALEQLPEVEPVLARFPGARVVIDHMAHPELEKDPARPFFHMLLQMARYQNLFVKVSALPAMSHEPYPHGDVLAFIRPLFDAFGPQRLMWGTDHAMTQQICPCSYEAALALVDRALEDESEADRAWIKGGTAARLWGWA